MKRFALSLTALGLSWLVTSLALVLSLNSTAQAQVITWTNTTDGLWAFPNNWSPVAAPISNSTVFITNGIASKTVTINSSTPAGNRTISNLTVSAPGAFVNTLQLTNTGVVASLFILNAFSVTSGGSLLVTNSLLYAYGFSGGSNIINGPVNVRNGGLTVGAGAGTYIGGAGNSGTLTIAGGTNGLYAFVCLGSGPAATGTLWLTGGQLETSYYGFFIGDDTIGSGGVGQMTMSNGTWFGSSFVVVGASIPPAGSVGTLTIAGGTAALPGLQVGGPGTYATGAVWVTGGQLTITNSFTIIGSGGAGRMAVSNGTWLAGEVVVAYPAGSVGTLTLAGGTNTLSSNLSVGFVASATGAVWVTGGLLVVTNSSTLIASNGVGRMAVSNGTWLARDAIVGNTFGSLGTLTIAGGTNTLVSNLYVGFSANATGAVWLTGSAAQLVVTNTFTAIGHSGVGQMTVSNGTWLARDVVVGNLGFPKGTLTIAGGTTRLSSDLIIGNGANSTGAVWLTGSTAVLVVTNSTTTIGGAGGGRMTVSNGTWLARNVNLSTGGLTGGGTLTVAGGTSSVFSNMTLGNSSCTPTGIVNVVGGRLFVTNGTSTAVLQVDSGTLTLNFGTLTVDKLVLTNSCGRFLKYGGALSVTTTNLVANLDADGDGLPNGWELQNGLDPFDDTGDNGASGDPDGDGFTNLEEFMAGGDPKMPVITKWEQLPDLVSGMDVRATWPKILAADFLCTATGPITDIHVWGSWSNDYVGTITNFHISFHSDIPKGVVTNWSMPGTELWSTNFLPGQFLGRLWTNGVFEFFYDPNTDAIIGSDTEVYEYSFFVDPARAFIQTNGVIYWLDVQAYTTNGMFGWKTTYTNWNDDAVWADTNTNLFWRELTRYNGLYSLDLAFALTTTRPLTKWVQPPELTNGMNVRARSPYILADDFLCTTSGPVTDVHIYGSWTNDYYGTITNFHISFHTDIPAAGTNWSRPGTELWSSNFIPGKFSAQFWTNAIEDFYNPPGTNIIGTDTQVYRYNFFIDPARAFIQTNGTIYWLDVQVFATNGLFGWKTSITNFNDDAVWGTRISTNITWIGDLHYPTGHPRQGQSIDLAFELTTIPTNPPPPPPDPFALWQLQYFGPDYTNNPAAAPNADPDGDGLSNTNEFLAGTVPTDSASALRITSVARVALTNIVITWMTAGGYTNAVQTNNPVAGSFTNNFSDLSGPIVITGSGDQQTNYTDTSGATNFPARYYRIRLVP